MAERSYGLVVEGTYDEPVFRELISRILSDAEVKIEVYTCGGKTKLLRKFPDYLKIFQHAAEGYPLDKALVIIDGDGRNPSELKEKMAGKISGGAIVFATACTCAWFKGKRPPGCLLTSRLSTLWRRSAGESAWTRRSGKLQRRLRIPKTA